MDGCLRSLYPFSTWVDIALALPGLTRPAVYQRARMLKIQRWNQGRGVVGTALAGVATPYELGWLAGFIDGEGTLQLPLRTRHGRIAEYLQPTIAVVNTDWVASQKTLEIMGGSMREQRPGLYSVKLCGVRQVAMLLTILLPYLTAKRTRAELLIEYAKIRQGRPGRATYGDAEWNLFRDFYYGSGHRGTRLRRQLHTHPQADAELNGEITLLNV